MDRARARKIVTQRGELQGEQPAADPQHPARRAFKQTPPAAFAPPSAAIRGSWPQDANEPQKIVARNVRCRGILQGMAVYAVVAHQLGVDHDAHALGPIIDDREGRHRAGGTPSASISSSGLPKLKRPAPKRPRQRLEVDARRRSCATTRKRSPPSSLRNRFLVCAPGSSLLELAALGDREHRLVLDGARGNAELGEAGEQVLAGCGHRRGGCELRAGLGGGHT